MAVLDIFSKRQKRLRGETHDTYRYDVVPDQLRVQIVHILEETVDHLYRGYPHWEPLDTYAGLAKALRREYGVFRLAASEYANDKQDVLEFVLREDSGERVLDVVELSFVSFIAATAKSPQNRARVEDAVGELNARFGEHGVGFQFSGGQVVRVDSEYVHAEVVKPALHLLNGAQYAGAQEEFLKAHAHFRRGETKDVLTESLKAFESVMKAICHKRKWAVRDQATASELIDVCFEKGLVPPFWQSQFSGLRSLLESGVPTARNRLGGHGQGPAPTSVPNHIAAYVIHMTAAAVVFLAEAEAALP